MRSTPLVTRIRRLAERGDVGSTLVITMMVMAIITGLATTVYVMSVRNLKNAGRDRQATAALSDAEAGVAQAISYMRSAGLKGLSCSPTCASNPWGNSSAPQNVSLASGETYQVWIEQITPFVPGQTAGVYRVHSVGKAGAGPASRSVTQDVTISPFGFPIAVYGNQINAGGGGKVLTESVFTSGCVFKRSQMTFQGIDPVYGIPAAAHSNSIITDDQVPGNPNVGCPSANNKNIHVNGVCNTSYPYDQDAQGGPLNGTTCYQQFSTSYPTTSYMNDVAKTYHFAPGGLSSAELDMLRTSAQQQGFYFTNTWQIPSVLQAASTAVNYPNPVLFYDLKNYPGRAVDLGQLDSATYGRPTPISADDPACTTRNFILVVMNGDIKLPSNATLVGSAFAMGPSYGNIEKSTGTANLIGTMYAFGNIDMTGTVNVNLDGCFLQNLPGNLLNFSPSNFREVDR